MWIYTKMNLKAERNKVSCIIKHICYIEDGSFVETFEGDDDCH